MFFDCEGVEEGIDAMAGIGRQGRHTTYRDVN